MKKSILTLVGSLLLAIDFVLPALIGLGILYAIAQIVINL